MDGDAENGVPRSLPLVFTHQTNQYATNVSCIFDNDSYTEMLNEEFDSYVMNPWSWNRDMEYDTGILALVPIALVTLVTNILVIFIFVRKQMLSALNVVLVGISVSDTLTVFIPAVAAIFSYLDGISPEYIPYTNCRLWAYLTKYVPTITHNASVWLTLILAFDRYIAIRHPFLIRRICLPRTSVMVIVLIYICATLGHLCRFIDTEYVPVKIISAINVQQNYSHTHKLLHNTTRGHVNVSYIIDGIDKLCKESKGIETCRAVYRPFFESFKQYEFCYYWFVILFVKFIPCTAMIILDTLMIKGLRQAEHIRHMMSAQCMKTLDKNVRISYYESRRMTLLVIIAVIIVIMVELPIGLILILWTLYEIHGQHLITESNLAYLSQAANGIVYISYPVIFLLYCSVSAQFRKAICNLCPCRKFLIFRPSTNTPEPSDV